MLHSLDSKLWSPHCLQPQLHFSYQIVLLKFVYQGLSADRRLLLGTLDDRRLWSSSSPLDLQISEENSRKKLKSLILFQTLCNDSKDLEDCLSKDCIRWRALPAFVAYLAHKLWIIQRMIPNVCFQTKTYLTKVWRLTDLWTLPSGAAPSQSRFTSSAFRRTAKPQNSEGLIWSSLWQAQSLCHKRFLLGT